MIRVLVWAACVLIIGIGYCGMQLGDLVALKKQSSKSGGGGFFIVMVVLAIVILILSINESQKVVPLP